MVRIIAVFSSFFLTHPVRILYDLVGEKETMGNFAFILQAMDLKILATCLLAYFCFVVPVFTQEELWRAENGKVQFRSDAPLETITAESKSLRGAIDPSKKTFAFSVRINSFEGFNSDIQQVHFLENYMEEKQFPQGTFQGKIIEDIPFDVPGEYTVRAKGTLTIHGISKERIIKGTLHVSKNDLQLDTRFTIPLSDHGITIPKIVMQKIAEVIDVTIDVKFMREKA
jgi:YceI-like protein